MRERREEEWREEESEQRGRRGGGQTDGRREENFLFLGANRKCVLPVSVEIRHWNVYTHIPRRTHVDWVLTWTWSRSWSWSWTWSKAKTFSGLSCSSQIDVLMCVRWCSRRSAPVREERWPSRTSHCRDTSAVSTHTHTHRPRGPAPL